jgi:hypothetical protein
MPEHDQSAPQAPGTAILAQAEVSRRVLLLAELQAALAAQQIDSVLARNHRLVLQYNRVPSGPSGMTDPQLHIFAPDGTDITTTDGRTFNLASGEKCPADDPAAAATFIRHGQHAAPRAWPQLADQRTPPRRTPPTRKDGDPQWPTATASAPARRRTCPGGWQ